MLDVPAFASKRHREMKGVIFVVLPLWGRQCAATEHSLLPGETKVVDERETEKKRWSTGENNDKTQMVENQIPRDYAKQRLSDEKKEV